MASYNTLYPLSRDDSPNDPPWFIPSGYQGGWDVNPSVAGRCALVGYFAGSNITNVTVTETDLVTKKLGMYRWVSYKLLDQTMQGTFDLTLGAFETSASANMFLKVYLYVTVGDTNAVRGVLLDYTDVTELPTSAQGVSLTTPQTLTPVAVTAGDRLVLELGVFANNVSATSFSATVYAGGTSDAALLTVGDTNVTTHRGSFAFSQAVLMDDPAPDPGDPISGNEQLYVYDRLTGDLKRVIWVGGPSGAGVTPDPSNGLQLSDGTWVFPTEDPASYLLFLDENFVTTNAVSAVGNRARSVTIDAQDHIYVGFRGDNNTNPTAPTYYPRKFSSSGTLLASYAVSIGTQGPSSIDLKSDQRTLVYVDRGRTIKAYDVVADVQLPDIATLPTESGPDYNTSARAYGIRCLIDGGYLVADLIDIKRLDSAGNIIRRYTEPNVEDWQSVTVGQGWTTFVSATLGAPDTAASASSVNPNIRGASGPGTPLAIKWNLTTGAKIFELLADVDPDTGGSQRGFTTTDGPTTGSVDVPEDVGTPEDYPVRYLRRSPIISDQEARIFHDRAQFVFQAGIGTTSGQGQDPQCLMRFSDDGGHTWSSEARRSIGEKGVYNARVTYFKLGQCRNRVYEVVVSDPAVPVVLIDLVLDLTKGEN